MTKANITSIFLEVIDIQAKKVEEKKDGDNTWCIYPLHMEASAVILI